MHFKSMVCVYMSTWPCRQCWLCVAGLGHCRGFQGGGRYTWQLAGLHQSTHDLTMSTPAAARTLYMCASACDAVCAIAFVRRPRRARRSFRKAARNGRALGMRRGGCPGGHRPPGRTSDTCPQFPLERKYTSGNAVFTACTSLPCMHMDAMHLRLDLDSRALV